MVETPETKINKSLFFLIISLLVLMCVSILIGLAGAFIVARVKNDIVSRYSNTSDLSTKCSNEGGVWKDSTKECERVSEPFCRSAGGVFDACASPCRNNGGAVACIQMCVQVCTFK